MKPNNNNQDCKFTIPHGDKWFRPDRAYHEYQTQAKGLDYDTINNNGSIKE